MDSRWRNFPRYFQHETAEFFFTRLMRHSYVKSIDYTQANWSVFCFDETARVICRKADLLVPLAVNDHDSLLREARNVAGYYLLKSRQTGRDVPLFQVPGYRWNGTVLHPRDNMLVIVQRRPRMVWKVLNQDSTQPGIIARDVDALSVFGTLVPMIHEYSLSGGLPYLKQEYALNTQPVSVAEFPDVLRQLTPAFVSGSVRAGIESITVSSWLARFQEEIRAYNNNPREFQDILGALTMGVERHLAAILDERPGLTVYASFAHGDLTPANIRRHRDQLKLIDWGNAGRRNILFDVLMADFGAMGKRKSSDWYAAACGRHLSTDAFRGWLEPYRRELHGVAGISLDQTTLAACVWAAIGEKLCEVAGRYSGRDDEIGIKSLKRLAETVPEIS